MIRKNLRGAARGLLLWLNPFRHVLGALRQYMTRTTTAMAIGADAQVLDYGCGESPYRALFPEECRYVRTDIPGNPRADFTLDANGRTGVANGSFDVVVSTQVLEHVDDPAVYLDECCRVLRAGGKLLLTTHGVMFLHEYPRDLWRWTGEGLKTIVERAGLRVTALEGIVGLVPTAIWLVMFEFHERLPWGVRQTFVLFCNVLMRLADRFTSDESRLRNACIYGLIAVKPAACDPVK